MATISIVAVGAPRSLAVGAAVALTALPAGAISYQWSFIDKAPTSAAALSTPTTQSAGFVVDAEGSYYIRCIVVLANGSVEEAKVLLSCPFLTSEGEVHIPAAGETFEADAIKGWGPSVQQALRIATLAFNIASQLTRTNKLRVVRAVSTVNLALTGVAPLAAADTDDVQLEHEDDVLLRAQTDPIENGHYTYTEDGGSYFLIRSVDSDENSEMQAQIVRVIEGTGFADNVFMQLTDDPDLGVSNIIYGLLGANLPAVIVPSGTATLLDVGGRRILRWTDGIQVFEVELGEV